MTSFSKLVGCAVLVASCFAAQRALAQKSIHYIDLNPYANRKLTGNLGSGGQDNSLGELPSGEQTLGGIKFQVGPGLIQLGSTMLDSLPEKVEDIVLDRKVAKLHFLHATCFGGGPNQQGSEGWVADGTLIGKYLVHYDDDTQAEIPIVFGEDVRDWWYVDGEAEPSRGKVVWKGDNEYAKRIGAICGCTSPTGPIPSPTRSCA